MTIPHIYFSSFGDNRASPAASGRFLDATIKGLARSGLNLLTQRIFGVDADACRMLGRHVIAKIAARGGSMLPGNTRPEPSIPFVFDPTPPDLSVSTQRRQKTNMAPLLCPQEGRGRSLPACAEQAEFPTTETTGVCR